MTRIERSVSIDAPADEVWAAISDLKAVANWNPNVADATTGTISRGVGATRTCELAPRGRIEEVVSGWTEGTEIWFAIGAHGAIRSADMGLVIHRTPEGAVVDAVADYHLALGPVGPVIDKLTTKRLMSHMLERALDGLKAHVETREESE